MKKFLDWVFDHGVGIAFTFILVAILSIVAVIISIMVGLVVLWDRIH